MQDIAWWAAAKCSADGESIDSLSNAESVLDTQTSIPEKIRIKKI